MSDLNDLEKILLDLVKSKKTGNRIHDFVYKNIKGEQCSYCGSHVSLAIGVRETKIKQSEGSNNQFDIGTVATIKNEISFYWECKACRAEFHLSNY